MEIKKIVCIGDSITWGFPYGPSYSWVEISSRPLGVDMVNRGINGDTARDLADRFNEDVLEQNPTHVLIMVGTNDASINVSLQDYSGLIEKMTAAAADSGIIPIVGMPIPSADKWLEYTLAKYRQWLREFTSANGLHLVDFSSGMYSEAGIINPLCYSDEVHPSKTGYMTMATAFHQFISRNLF